MAKAAVMTPPRCHVLRSGGAATRSFGSAARPFVETLALAPLAAEAVEDAHQRVRHLVDRLRALDPVDEGGVAAETAAQTDVDPFDDGVAVLAVSPRNPMSAICGCAHEAEQPEKCMRTISAPSICTRRSSSCAHCSALAFVSTMARRQNSLPVQATAPALERLRARRVRLQQRLGQQGI